MENETQNEREPQFDFEDLGVPEMDMDFNQSLGVPRTPDFNLW